MPIKKAPLAAALALALALACSSSVADEGMWTYNEFPSAQVGKAYGFTPDQAWLDHLRLSSVKFGNGCSGSIVSASGLVMTNHHCARTCIENLSGLAHKDYNRGGFFARTPREEARCPGLEIDQLTAIGDVTREVQAATEGTPPEKFNDVQKAAIASIEKACSTSDDERCEVVTLYRGGRYDLYHYRRFQEVRLVFAPEEGIAFFGGDPDNFNFPRFDLDVSFVRLVDAAGKPLATPQHLAWSDGRLREGDVTFVSGHPGATSRGFTLAQFDDDRDVRLPKVLYHLAELRGFLTEYQHRGPEQKRQSTPMLFGVENRFKALKGRQEALADKAFHGQLERKEAAFRDRVQSDPALAQKYAGVWDAMAALVQKQQALRDEYEALEVPSESRLFRIARDLLRHGEELTKPDGDRLKEYTDARLPQMAQEVLANRPLYPELEIATLGWWLTKMREELGADHPVVRQVFGTRSPAQIAAAAVNGSRLAELRTDARGNPVGGYRKALYDGGKTAVDASHDPMIALARAFDGPMRAIRKRMETEVDGPMKKQQELLAQARFAVHGTGAYPDATSTLRLSYGAVQGWEEDGRRVAPFTTLGGAFARATGADPFALPDSWQRARSRLDLDVPFNFVTTNDIIGGNSGSPVVDAKGAVVGLVFDGNIHSLGGDYGFDAATNRTVAVSSRALIEAMSKVYGADRLVAEIRGPAATAGAVARGGSSAPPPADTARASSAAR
jgi:hypothetical protein